jgi:MFS family permease
MATVAEGGHTQTARSQANALIVFLFAVILLNYVDRGAISIAAPLLKPELHLDATHFGIAVSAFFWVYAPMQFVLGWLMDRWCVYRLLALGVALWAAATMLTSLVTGLTMLVLLRILLGLGESFTFPAANKIMSRHIGPERRGIANSAVGMGIAFGPAVGIFAGGLIVSQYGWRPVFAVFGFITLLWLVPWIVSVRRLPSYAPQNRERPVALSRVLRQRSLWAMAFIHFCATYGVYFVLTWLPLFLVQSRGLPIVTMTYIATLGFVAQGVSAFLMGWTSDLWTRSGRDGGAYRRWSMIITQLIVAGSILLLINARNPAEMTFWIVVICAASAGSSVHNYAVAQSFAGPRIMGSFMGVQNGLGNMSGIVMPIVTGMIIDTTGSYSNAFILTSAVAVLGAIGWAFFVPDIRRIELD